MDLKGRGVQDKFPSNVLTVLKLSDYATNASKNFPRGPDPSKPRKREVCHTHKDGDVEQLLII